MTIDTRRIVQLINREKMILALCTDGTVWRLERDTKAGYSPDAYTWTRMSTVPQE